MRIYTEILVKLDVEILSFLVQKEHLSALVIYDKEFFVKIIKNLLVVNSLHFSFNIIVTYPTDHKEKKSESES